MGIRVSDDMVKEIIDIDENITNILPFIMTASNLVDRIEKKDSTIDAGTLRLIEQWLSAHFVAISDMRSDNEKAGSVGQKFQYKLGLNLQVTMYGQQALIIDPTGLLKTLNSNDAPKVASMNYIGG